MTTDLYVLGLLELALFAITAFAIWQDYKAYRLKRKPRSGVFADGEVLRGEKSVATIVGVFIAAQAAAYALVSTAQGLDGNKVVFMALNFACISYIFFLNSWFRNAVFFPLKERFRRD